ncbi:MAG: hypothetical protein EU535_03845 [Promethearchaeota archaeon]|nr:MAG: hypothetical protein EU535_03845 [Candidatus Lokiarchaeota archaeon]
MAEILEKGLLIGFGLSVAIFFFSIFTPYISIIFSRTQEPLDQHDTFVYTIEYGLSYENGEDELHLNMSLSIEILLSLNFMGDELFLNITSPLKSTLLSSPRLILLSNSSITGDFEVIFSYDVNLVIISFWGET